MSSPRLLDQVRDRLRVKHYSMRTEDIWSRASAPHSTALRAGGLRYALSALRNSDIGFRIIVVGPFMRTGEESKSINGSLCRLQQELNLNA